MWDILGFFLSPQFWTEYAQGLTHCRKFQSGCPDAHCLPATARSWDKGGEQKSPGPCSTGEGDVLAQWKTHKFRQTKHSNKYLIRKQTWNHRDKVGIREELGRRAEGEM